MKTHSLFCKEGKKWTRLTPLALEINAARRFFQDMLLGGVTRGKEMALRPAEEDHENTAAYKANMDRLFPRT